VIKAEFSVSLLQSSVSHAPSEIMKICWFAQEMYIIIINGETVVLLHIFEENIFFPRIFDE